MRIAIPVWNGRISPLLDTAHRYWIVETKETPESATSRSEFFIEDECYLHRRCRRLRRLGVQVVICGAVSRRFSTLIQAAGIELIEGISGTVDEVLAAYLENRLTDKAYRLPGRQGPPRL
jgi:predicted Fe-Mo cluster-binding NifX family protein